MSQPIEVKNAFSSTLAISGSVTESNSSSIKTAVQSIDGKITVCNTGAVVISSQSKNTSSITTWENPSSVISFNSNGVIPQNIKASSGSLISMSVFNNAGGNAIGYLAIYDELAVNVVVGITTPKMVLALNHNVSLEIPCHNVQFSTAISYFVATAYNGAIHLAGIYLTAFYDN